MALVALGIGGAHVANLATKDELRAEASDIRREIANVKTDIIKWVVGSQVFMLGAIAALIRFANLLG